MGPRHAPCRCHRLDYPGIGPEHSFLKDVGRAEYFAVTDNEALEGFQLLSRWVAGESFVRVSAA